MFRRLFPSLAWIVAGCGPNVESTSETLETGATGGQDGDAGEAGGTGNDPCGGETPPPLLAYFDAFERMEVAFDEMGADLDAVRQDLAMLLGLPADAGTADVVAAIEATYAANVGPGSAMVIASVQCSGVLDAERENLAICGPDLVLAEIGFACEGECTIAAPEDCPSPRCRGVSPACQGTCTGACTLEASGACEGICTGTCDGECGCPVDGGLCAGPCSGMCTGACEIVEANCSGGCEGTCTGATFTTCDGTWWCDAPGYACGIDCAGWAEPIGVDAGCRTFAAAAGAASGSCAPPYASLVYASIACSDFAGTAAALEDAAARLHRDLYRFQAIVERSSPLVNELFDAIMEELDLTPCVAQLVLDHVDRFGVVVAEAQQTAVEIQTLTAALDPA